MKRMLFILTILFTLSDFLQKGSKRLTYFHLERNEGIRGYDPKVYEKEGKAVKAKKEIAALHEGIIYQCWMAVIKDYFLKNYLRYGL